MKPKTAAILRHILDSLFLIAISTTLILLIWVTLQSNFENLILWLSQVNGLVLIFILLVLPCVLAWQFPKTIMSIFWSIFLFPKHLGFALRVFFCSGLTLGIAWWFDLIRYEYVWTILAYEIVIVLFGVVIAKFHLYLHNKSKYITIDPEKDDRPIRTLAEDRIPGFKNIAEKILSHLQIGTETDNHGPNVALIGSYGSGKTSLCNLIEDTYKKLHGDQKKIKIIFCCFEAWQYLTADAAVRGLLDCIVSQIKKFVDSAELSTIPERYLEALGACPHWSLKILSILLKRKRSPEEIVQILQNVLLRINRKVVVFVDDLDRLENRSTEAQDAIAAALNQLQNLTSVQYVLCVGSSMTMDTDKTPQKTNYDLLKSTRFQELIPDMPSEDILNRIAALRNEAISLDENMFYLWHEKDSDDPLRFSPILESFSSSMASQIIKLIQTPRELKTLERETREKWKGLNGEISWYDLVMINIIKACELPVFEWIINEKHIFLDGTLGFKDQSGDEKQKLRSSIEDRLKGRISVKTEARFELVRQVLLDLFPNFMKGLGGAAENTARREPRPCDQRLSFKPIKTFCNVSYFERFKSGRVPESEIPDQFILRYIKKISKDDFQKKEFEDKFLDSFQKLTNDFNRFQQFGGLLTRDLAIKICDCILDWMCNRSHWEVWTPQDEYPIAVMHDVKTIFEDSGQFHTIRSFRHKQQAISTARNSEIWVTQKLKELVTTDVIVALQFSHEFFAEETVIGKMIEPYFLSGSDSIWEKLKGGRYYLIWVLNALVHNESYAQNRDKITNLVIEKAKSDNSDEILGGVIMSLVETKHSPKSPDSVEQYSFNVNQIENEIRYNMKMIFPLIQESRNSEFKDPIVARAFEHLLGEYANELKAINKI
jgi:hypothetical protein